MQITKFDPLTCKLLRAAIEKALATLPPDLGVQVTLGKISYSDEFCTLKMECGVKSENGTVVTKEAKDFLSNAVTIGMKPELLNQEFTTGGRVFILKGYRVRAQAKPFVVTSKADGKSYIMSGRPVYAGFGLTIPEWLRD